VRRVRVKRCRRDHIGSTSGVPQISDDLLAPPKSAELGQEETPQRLPIKAEDRAVQQRRASLSSHD
jgi:hypothetical protein